MHTLICHSSDNDYLSFITSISLILEQPLKVKIMCNTTQQSRLQEKYGEFLYGWHLKQNSELRCYSEICLIGTNFMVQVKRIDYAMLTFCMTQNRFNAETESNKQRILKNPYAIAMHTTKGIIYQFNIEIIHLTM